MIINIFILELQKELDFYRSGVYGSEHAAVIVSLWQWNLKKPCWVFTDNYISQMLANE